VCNKVFKVNKKNARMCSIKCAQKYTKKKIALRYKGTGNYKKGNILALFNECWNDIVDRDDIRVMKKNAKCRKYTRIYVSVKCPKCKEKRYRSIKDLIYSIEEGTFSGYCIKCYVSKGRSLHLQKNGKRIIGKRRYIDERGYISVRIKRNSKFYDMSGNGIILEHRLIMAKYLGRSLKSWEHVHHIDGNKSNNDIDNLELKDGSIHLSMHKRTRDMYAAEREQLNRVKKDLERSKAKLKGSA